MADTGAPHFIPFADPTDLVRDWPALSEDVADAVAAGLTAAGGLVEIKYAAKTDAQTFNLGTGAFASVDGLSIAHAVSNASNDVILLANLSGKNGQAGVAHRGGLAVFAGGTIVEAPDSPGSRFATMSFSGQGDDGGTFATVNMSVIARHTPGTTDSVTYDVRVGNGNSGTITWYVNRTRDDDNIITRARGVSTLILMEVKV